MMKFATIFQLEAKSLKNSLYKELKSMGYKPINNEDFLYAEGNAPYMVIAHLDTVHKIPPNIICYSADGNYIMSPQGIGGDDRCGVYIILEVLKKLPFKPYVLFTMDEEIGGLGAKAFVDYMDNPPDLKYIVEYDRKGNQDCVFYRCDNRDFVEFVENFGFNEAYGSFSDISIIAPAFGVAAVNLSSGYYNPHTQYEYVCMQDMRDVIEKSVEMLCADCETFEYIEKKFSQYSVYQNIYASPIPSNTVLVYTEDDEWRSNMDNEVFIDVRGNYYLYNKLFNDYSRTVSVYSDEPIEYDYTLAKSIWVYTGGQV